MLAYAVYQRMNAHSLEAGREIDRWSMNLLQAIHFMTFSAAKMSVFFGMRSMRTGVFANGIPGYTIYVHDLMNDTCILKILKNAV